TGNFEKAGKQVLVIGGGNVAVDAARSSRRLPGVQEVHLVMLEGSKEEAPAHDWEIEETLEEGITIHFGRGTVDIFGESGSVEGINLKKCTSVFDAEGKFNPQYDENDIETVYCDTIVFAVGQGVDPTFAGELETTRGGRFVVDDLTLQTSIPNVFVAGDAAGKSVIAVEALAEGRKAAKSVHRLLTGKSLTADREGERAFETDLETEIPEDASREPRVATRALDPETRVSSFVEVDLGFSEQQARAEASRCLSCECLKCMKECTMLNDFSSCPKELFEGILAEPEIIAADPKIAYSCNMCKQCTLACPKDFDMQGIFGGMRKQYVEANNGKSPMKGHNVIYMHQKLGFSKAFNTTVASPDGVTKRVFIPGCSLPSYNPEAVGKIYSHLQATLGNTGAILKCCGKPTKALGQYDLFKERYAQLQAEIDKLGAQEIIVACQSCFLNMSEYSPNQKVRSLWEIMPEIGLPEGAEDIGLESDATFAIHDSCSTRHVSSIHEGIRWIIEKTGYQSEEPPHTKENGMCCGFGGMVVPANPDLAQRVMIKRTSEVKSDQMVTYCAACRESMVKGGKKAVHILDLLFNPTYKQESEYPGLGKGPLEAWVNRYKAKKALQQAAKKAPAKALV
ncbi:MAG: FAD-dependent oxidoreductase, partial [Alkalispirochaetaceae bacterium]